MNKLTWNGRTWSKIRWKQALVWLVLPPFLRVFLWLSWTECRIGPMHHWLSLPLWSSIPETRRRCDRWTVSPRSLLSRGLGCSATSLSSRILQQHHQEHTTLWLPALPCRLVLIKHILFEVQTTILYLMKKHILMDIWLIYCTCSFFREEKLFQFNLNSDLYLTGIKKKTLVGLLLYCATVKTSLSNAGFICASRGLSLPSHLCPAGSYCPYRHNSSLPGSITCSAGHMCPLGSAIQVPCVPGTYQDQPGQVGRRTFIAVYFIFTTGLVKLNSL